MVTPHCASQIEKRHINIDIEMVEYLTQKSEGIDTAFVLGKVEFLGDENFVILVVRDYKAITIEFRRTSQSLNCNCLKVESIVEYTCLF